MDTKLLRRTVLITLILIVINQPSVCFADDAYFFIDTTPSADGAKVFGLVYPDNTINHQYKIDNGEWKNITNLERFNECGTYYYFYREEVTQNCTIYSRFKIKNTNKWSKVISAEISSFSEKSPQNSSKYYIVISKLGTDEKGIYLEFDSSPAYFYIPEYVEKCKVEKGKSSKQYGRLYYERNYPVEIRDNGGSKHINIQDIELETYYTMDEIYENLNMSFDYNEYPIIEVFSEKGLSGKEKLYISPNCLFEMGYGSNLDKYTASDNFYENINKLRDEANCYDSGESTIYCVNVKDSKIVEISINLKY